jgi:hypothetical protein
MLMRPVSALVNLCWLFALLGFAGVRLSTAQNTGSIFLTPVADAPFTGVIVIQRTVVAANGGSLQESKTIQELKTIREVARDSQGRVRNVFRQLIPASDSAIPPIVRIHFYDPQTRDYTYLYPQQKVYVTGTVNHPPAAHPADLIASASGNSAPLNQFTKLDDLGTQSIGGVPAHGVREIQTIPAASSSTGHEVVLTDEYWFSEELHMNVVMKHNDPRGGSFTMTLTEISLDDPDPSLFQIPEGYTRGTVGTGGPDSQQPTQDATDPTSK